MGFLDPAAIMVGDQFARTLAEMLLLGRRHGPNAKISEVVAEQVPDVMDRRRVTRQLETAAETVAARLVSDPVEFRGLADAERLEAMTAVAESWAAAELTVQDVIEADMDPVSVADLIRRRSGRDERHRLSGPAQSFYDFLLRETTAVLIAVVTGLPTFPSHALTTLLRREGELSEIVDGAVSRLSDGTVQTAEPEASYRSTVADVLDRVELFGFDVAATVQHQRLTDTFAQPTVQIQRTDLPLDWAVCDNRLLFLHGPAGSGKTSILKWLAVSSARRAHSGLLTPLNDLLPLYVQARGLRNEADFPADIHALTRLALPAATTHATESAIRRRAAEGGLLILIDGIDETSPEVQKRTLSWLEHIIGSYPACQYVVTSRHGGRWAPFLESRSFAIAEVLPLDRSATTQLVRQWFGLLGGGEPTSETNRLLDIIEADSRLRDIASTPLMCTLACLLFREQGELAFHGFEIYRAFIEMFVERRDVQRAISGSRGLPRHETLLLLGRLALQMVLADVTELSKEQAVHYLDEERMALPRALLSSEVTYDYLVQRSGMLIEPAPDRVQFVHRSFMEYLCAESFLDHHSVDELVRNAHKPTWRGIVPMTTALSHGRQTEEIVHGLLERYRREPLRRTVLDPVLQACMVGVSRLDPEIRHEVDLVRRRNPLTAKGSQQLTLRLADENDLRRLHEWLYSESVEPFGHPAVVSDIGPDDTITLTSSAALSIGEVVQVIFRWLRLNSSRISSTVEVVMGDGVKVTIGPADPDSDAAAESHRRHSGDWGTD
ncbi:hypothetical protein ABH920_004973 [Catenulispora sp. EB89]|uniref:NACHT domain-containing protein n=1 Tax=Catenulispora sp. EB89 TaxID=3156257 RepID=UPI0035120BD0